MLKPAVRLKLHLLSADAPSMALPVDFPEKNFVKQAPANMPDCRPLPCWIDDTQVVSCWEFSPEELAEIARTGKMYISVLAPVSTPPMWLTGLNPFVQPEPAAEAE
jgi:hypothetical protein